MGAGRLGPVFRAYDPDRDRLVAVKLFKLDLPPERVHQLVAAFERLIAAELTHPAIAAPVATGIVDVSAYLAQEYVAAESLDLAIREYGPAPPADALRVAAQLAGALDFAAVVDIVHGALHPRDVLLAAEETRVTGIGVARALEQVGVAAPVRRPYTAPERMGEGPWDRRADIFSLAALVHELLWGRRITATGPQAAAALTDVRDADMPMLRAVFARALADDPRLRFTTALEFAEALKNAFPDVTVLTSSSENRESSLEAADLAARAATAQPPAEELETIRRPPQSDPEWMPAMPIRVQQPDLPLAPIVAEPAEDTIPMATTPGAVAPPELDLRAAAEARYADAEVAPAVVPASAIEASDGRDNDATIAENDQPTVAETDQPTVPGGLMGAAAPEPPRRSTGAMIATLILGAALGFAGGYLVGVRSQPAEPPAPAQTAPPVEQTAPRPAQPPPPAQPAPPATRPQAPATPPQAGREFTEGTVAQGDRGAARDPRGSGSVRSQPDQAAAADAEARAASIGRLLVRSTPAGATVFVDGREVGRTPVAVRDLARGTHRVRLVRDGYLIEERHAVITQSRPAQSMTIALSTRRAAEARVVQPGEPTPGTPGTMGGYAGALLVESRPAGAKVFLDNRMVGTTPLTIDAVAAGEHAVRLEHDGYRRWSASVRIVSAERNRVTASLER